MYNLVNVLNSSITFQPNWGKKKTKKNNNNNNNNTCCFDLNIYPR